MARDFAKKLYSSEQWQQLRMALIAERGPVCQQCGRIIARPVDIIGHHEIELTPENIHDYNISINPNFIKLICFDCHNKYHQRFGYQPEHQVYLVYGAPLSGKKIFVRENMQRGDLVVDMDSLYAAVSLLPAYDKPDNLFSNVIGIHNLLIDNIKCRYGRWGNAWVIGGYADRYKREKLADDLGAELIFCDVSRDECLRRLELDEDRRYRKDEWINYINKWFDEYVS
ncbi:MAG TPA: HNH endonuclease [Desulfitobacteriaceae bacterium]|nr:HNH endonuclease [Desulfitobacteriaceae bacterium]